MRTRIALFLAAVAVTVSVHGADLAGPNVLVPIAGRTAGTYGSHWQTDLVITNLDAQPVPLTLTFHGPDAERVVMTTTVWGRGTVVLDDILLKTFHLPSAMGMIRVSSSREGARFTARAYIVNRGGVAGEFGQGVPGVPIDALTTEHTLSGIAAGEGLRTNVGIANPWSVPASVILTLHGPAGQSLGQLHRIVPALEVLQVNDAFAAFGAEPVAAASVSVTSQVSVYAYASIVRNDSGDAVFIPGTGLGVQTASQTPPRCPEPASLVPARPDQEPAEGWIVMMQPETAVDEIMNVLPARYGFALANVYDALPGFAAELTPQQIASLRCEASVLFIQQNVVVPLP